MLDSNILWMKENTNNIFEWEFSLEKPNTLKNNTKSYIQEFENLWEFKVENNTWLSDLKNWIIDKERLINICDFIRNSYDDIDWIVFTPDSWKKEWNILESKDNFYWFSKIVYMISKELWIPLIIPKIKKEMKKQKNCSLEERIKNKKWWYEIDEDIKWKNILFIDDVLTSWATMFVIWEEIYKKWWNFQWFVISKARMDK